MLQNLTLKWAKNVLGIQEMTVFSFFSSYLGLRNKSVWALSQNLQMFLRFFVQNPIASSCLLLAHDYNNNQFKWKLFCR